MKRTVLATVCAVVGLLLEVRKLQRRALQFSPP